MEVENSEIFKLIEKKKYDTRKVGEFTLVSNGLLGQKSDIIVDNVRNPKKIFGLCDGKGDFISLSKKSSFIKKISKALRRKIEFV